MKATTEKESQRLTKGQMVLEEWKKRKAISEAESLEFAKTERFKEIMEELRIKNAANGIITPGV